MNERQDLWNMRDLERLQNASRERARRRSSARDGRGVIVQQDLAERLAADTEPAPLVAEDPAPAADPREFLDGAVGVLSEGHGDGACAADDGDGVCDVGVGEQRRGEEVGVVCDAESGSRGDAEEGREGGGDGCYGGGRVDAGDAERRGGEGACVGRGDWEGSWETERGGAGGEGGREGGGDGRGEVGEGEIGKVGGTAESACEDCARGIANDGRRLGAAAVDAQVQRHC